MVPNLMKSKTVVQAKGRPSEGDAPIIESHDEFWTLLPRPKQIDWIAVAGLGVAAFSVGAAMAWAYGLVKLAQMLF